MSQLACRLYDQLEIFAMRRTNVEITYIDEKGEEFREEGIIKDLITKNGVEFIVLNNDKTIDVKDLITVSGIDFQF